MKTDERQIDTRVPLERWIEREVLRQPDQLAMSFMNAPNIGIAICDLQFRFRTLNQALARMNGIPLEKHIGKTIYEVLGDFAGKVEPLFQQVVSSGNSSTRALAGSTETAQFKVPVTNESPKTLTSEAHA